MPEPHQSGLPVPKPWRVRRRDVQNIVALGKGKGREIRKLRELAEASRGDPGRTSAAGYDVGG